MIVDNLHIPRAFSRPAKTYAELIVYANAVLPGAVACQGFQPVARWYTEIIEPRRLIEDRQLPHSDSLYIDESLHSLALEQRLGVFTAERLNHRRVLTAYGTTVNRQYWPHLVLNRCPRGTARCVSARELFNSFSTSPSPPATLLCFKRVKALIHHHQIVFPDDVAGVLLHQARTDRAGLREIVQRQSQLVIAPCRLAQLEITHDQGLCRKVPVNGGSRRETQLG